MYDFEALLPPLNEHPIDDLTCLSRHIPISVAVYDTLSKESVYSVDKKPEALTEKQEAIAADVLKQHPHPSDFKTLPGEVKEQWKQWIKQVSVIGFNSSKYDLNMVKEYFLKGVCYTKADECNEDVLAAKK